MNFTSLSEKIKRNPPLDFGNIFSASFELFKKTWGQGVLMVIMNMILILPAILVLYIPIIAAAAAGSYDPEMQGGNLSVWAMLPFFLLFIPVMILVQTITLGLTAGFYKIVREKDLEKDSPDISLFMFLKKKYFGKLFMLSLFSVGIALLAVILCYIPILYVSVPLSLVAVVFAFNPELTPKEVIRACFQLGNKKWFLIFGLAFVAGFLAQMVGLILCGIGIFFTASFINLPNYFVYKNTIGFEDEDEIAQIGGKEL